MLLLPSAWTYEEGLPTEVGIPGFLAGAGPVISGTGADLGCSFSLRCESEEPVSIAGCYPSAFSSTDRLEGPGYGSRSGTGLIGQDFGDPGTCLRYGTRG